MSVLVDTCVWSLALRRGQPGPREIVEELEQLILDGQVVMLGAIRQEVLSGIRSQRQFGVLRERLRAFPDVKIGMHEYERAAEMFNTCRSRGIQGSNTDFLICAAAERWNVPVFTTDKDFEHYATTLDIHLYMPRR